MTYDQPVGEVPAPQLRRYRCIKHVSAAKIVNITMRGEYVTLYFEQYPCVSLDADWFNKHQPSKGGYYVMYGDGYSSFSPAKAFEQGYVPTDDLTPDEAIAYVNSAQDAMYALQRFAYQTREASRKELDASDLANFSNRTGQEPARKPKR